MTTHAQSAPFRRERRRLARSRAAEFLCSDADLVDGGGKDDLCGVGTGVLFGRVGGAESRRGAVSTDADLRGSERYTACRLWD